MKKIKCIFIMLYSLFIFSGCSSIKTSSVYSTNELKDGFSFKPENIYVSIDHVKDLEIRNQIYDLVSLKLHSKKINKDSSNELKINIIQRTFLYGTKYLNSISIRCYVVDINGNVMAEKNKIITSKKITMLSAIHQNKYLLPLVRAIKRKV